MSDKTFNVFIGTCESCRRMIFENNKRYWVRFGGEGYCFCEKCVTVIEPKKMCDCYREEYGRTVCYGTKEREECTCGGYREKCNFYEK